MFTKLTIYRAYCDGCKRQYDVAAPKSVLKTHMDMNGWRVAGDDVTCPDCIAKESEGNED